MNFLPNPSADFTQYTPIIPEDVHKAGIGALIGALAGGAGDGSSGDMSTAVAPTGSGSSSVNGFAPVIKGMSTLGSMLGGAPAAALGGASKALGAIDSLFMP